ncbi:MAG: ATP-binding protein [Thermoleophilia bacterium]
MSRLPIRLRLTLVFAGAMLVALLIGGALLRLRVSAALDGNIDQALRARAADVSALVAQSDEGLRVAGQSPLTERGEAFAQVLDARGGIFDATPLLRDRSLLTPGQLRRARAGRIVVDRSGVAGLEDDVRLLATPVTAQDQRLVVVVGASLEDRNDTLRTLTLFLFVAAPVALVVTAAAAHWVAAAALRPAEAMRRRAARISGEQTGERLPLPGARDEIHHLGETLNDMLDRIELAMRRQREFVADASHELRTPLAILTSELELARRPGTTHIALKAAVDSAAEETERLVRLAEDLLVFARADAGRLPVRPEPVMPAALTALVATRFTARAGAAGRRIEVLNEADGPVRLDTARIEQALGNLVDNALRHGEGTVFIRTQSISPGLLRFCVGDDGHAMTEAFAAHAFDRFTRADPARGRDGGAGLGLAIVRAIAQAHGGSSGISLGPRGTRVWFTVRVDLGGEGDREADDDRRREILPGGTEPTP